MTSFFSRIWQILAGLASAVALFFSVGKRIAESKRDKAESELLLKEIEQLRNDSALKDEALKANKEQKQKINNVQAEIDNAVKPSEILKHDKEQIKAGESYRVLVFLFAFFLTACAPKVITETKYIEIEPVYPVLRELTAYTPQRVDVKLQLDGETVCTSKDNMTAITDYIAELRRVNEGLNGQIRAYNSGVHK